MTNESSSEKNCKSELRFNRIVAMSLWPHFLAHRVYIGIFVQWTMYQKAYFVYCVLFRVFLLQFITQCLKFNFWKEFTFISLFQKRKSPSQSTVLESLRGFHSSRPISLCGSFYSRREQGCSSAGTRWNAVPANILEPERRSGNYRWPQVER